MVNPVFVNPSGLASKIKTLWMLLTLSQAPLKHNQKRNPSKQSHPNRLTRPNLRSLEGILNVAINHNTIQDLSQYRDQSSSLDCHILPQ